LTSRPPGGGSAQVIDTEARWEQAHWLLHEDSVRPEDRAAGLLVLLRPAARGDPLPELDIARVRRWCERRVPRRRDQVRVECDIGSRQLTIVECRPPWGQGIGPEWTRLPIARLRYTQATNTWTLYWRDRNLRFHRSDQIGPSPQIEDLLREIDRDPTAIFWG